MTRTRLGALAALGLASTVLLTGCNAVPGFNPGVAARVDSTTISVNRVNDLTASYCDYLEVQLQEGQAVPMHYLSSRVAGALALRAAADRFAVANDVTADPAYDEALAQAEASLAELPADQRDAVIEVQGAELYVQAVEQSVGAALLPDGAPDAQAAAGKEAFGEWLEDNDVRINPRFGITIDSGATTPTDTSLSFGQGAVTELADAEQPDAEYAADLPESQRCG